MTRSKWTVLAFLLLAIPLAGASAQNSLSIRAGANFASVGGDEADDTEGIVGLNLGGAFTVGLYDNVGLFLGANYSQKGAEDNTEGSTARIEVDYIEIPLLLKLAIPTGGSVSVHFFGGPSLAFEVGCSLEAEEGGVEVSIDCDGSELEGEVESFDFGATGGAGIDIDVGGGRSLSLDAFYTFGFADVTTTDDVQNRVFTVQAGLAFPIGG